MNMKAKINHSSSLFERIDHGAKQAIQIALLEHKKLGRAIHIEKDGQIIEISPEHISINHSILQED